MSQEEPEPQWIKDLRKDITRLNTNLEKQYNQPQTTTDPKLNELNEFTLDTQALERLTKHTNECTDPDCIIKTKLKTLTKPATKTCTGCEKQIEETATYCPNCGENQTEEEW